MVPVVSRSNMTVDDISVLHVLVDHRTSRSGGHYACLPMMSRSRSNIAATARQASRSMASRTAASPTARPADTAITLSEISARMASSGRRAEHAQLLGDAHISGAGGDRDPHPDPPAGEQWGEQQLNQHVRAREDRRGDHRVGKEGRSGEEDAEDQVGDDKGRNEGGERLGDEELLAADRGDQDRLQRALLALSDHRVGGQGGRQERRDHQHVQHRERRRAG